MSFTPITVTGKYLDPSNDPAFGYVVFQLNTTMIDATDDVFVAAAERVAVLSSTGTISLTLMANDDATTTPTGTYYTVTEYVNNETLDPYDVVIPHAAAGGTVDLSTLNHVSPGGSLGLTGSLADEQIIRMNTLDQMAIPVNNVNMNGFGFVNMSLYNNMKYGSLIGAADISLGAGTLTPIMDITGLEAGCAYLIIATLSVLMGGTAGTVQMELANGTTGTIFEFALGGAAAESSVAASSWDSLCLAAAVIVSTAGDLQIKAQASAAATAKLATTALTGTASGFIVIGQS